SVRGAMGRTYRRIRLRARFPTKIDRNAGNGRTV
ncbi:MAG: hypothetical protein QOJ30_5764, partial [Pseudonocardiales bacterium]|nr:hypothetical protein [Pseudonocardiales bacterium]